jgi:hypothetical protein|tara:strand:- start:912 stop:1091 length:180 start_codon:yes stop_codon:yes gene_type:complete
MVELTLNQPGSESRFHPYFGKPSHQLFEIYIDGLVPLTTAGLMQRRLDVKDGFLELSQV